MVKWAKQLFNKHDLIIVFFGSTLVGLMLYSYDRSREFGVNFITEMAGVWITVFLVNRIMEKRERKKRVYIDQRILQDSLSIIASYFSIWKHLAWKYVPQSVITSETDFIKIYPDIISSAQLSQGFEVVSIHDPESWKLFFHNRTIKDCFSNYREALQGDIRSLIDNFKIHLEPQLLGYLLEINESKYLREVNSIFQTDTADVLSDFGQDTDKLASYITDDVNHFNTIFELIAYCHGLNTSILEFTDFRPAHYDFNLYFGNPMTPHSPAKQIV